MCCNNTRYGQLFMYLLSDLGGIIVITAQTKPRNTMRIIVHNNILNNITLVTSCTVTTPTATVKLSVVTSVRVLVPRFLFIDM